MLLLTLPAMPIERVQQDRKAAGQLVRLVQVLPASLERLLANHRAPVALHGRTVCRDKLGGHRSFKLVPWMNAYKSGYCRRQLTVSGRLVRVLQPQATDGVVCDLVVPVIRHRTADAPQLSRLL